jgi:hypothetical protein
VAASLPDKIALGAVIRLAGIPGAEKRMVAAARRHELICWHRR